MPDRPWPNGRDFERLSLWWARPGPPLVAGATLRASSELAALAVPAGVDACLAEQLRQRWLEWRRTMPDAALITFWDPVYPPLLREIAHPPLVLFARGVVQDWGARLVAIVGARAASVGARAFTADLAGDLARCGVVVASGMARGIDAAAHRGALGAGGATIAVLGCGPDICYPPEHAALAERIAAHGCILTELPPGTPPRAWHFPRRNRILAGIAAGVVVVQAEPKSGALVTARHAVAENREVMAVPGDVGDPRSSGPHALLRDGAVLVDGVRAVLDALRWQPAAAPAAWAATASAPNNGATAPAVHANAPGGDAGALLGALGRGASADALCARLGWDAARVQRTAAALELAGLVARTPAGLLAPVTR
jgi:DNA processing protein